MRTRTYLTTPPDREPTDATGRAEIDDERYLPALELPTEPRVPSKNRRLVIAITVFVVLSLLIITLLRIGAAAQSEDPAMTDPSLQQPAEEPTDGDGEGPSLRG